MYYLNDKHPEFEYAIYCYVKGAIPYLAPRTFEDINDVYRYLDELAKNNNRYHRVFYIDNDFFENEYSKEYSNLYYKVLRRQVLDWKEFNTKENDNIINISDYYMKRIK